jgi:hypothetical protein
MTEETSRYIAVDPTATGFAYAVFETPDRLIAWGLAKARDDRAWVERFERLLSVYQPEIIVTEAPGESRRGSRVLRLLEGVETIALLRSIWTHSVPKRAVWEAFPEARSKHDIAVSLVERFPELRPRLPRKRRAWTSEDARMRIFDALSLIAALLPTNPLPAQSPQHELFQTDPV